MMVVGSREQFAQAASPIALADAGWPVEQQRRQPQTFAPFMHAAAHGMPDDLGGRCHPWHVGMKTGGDLIGAMFVGNHDQGRGELQNRETLDSFTFQMAQPTGDLSTLKQMRH